MTQAVSIRWFIVVIAVVGICCAVVGTVLGAMKASGREHLTVSLLLIGESYTHTSHTRAPCALSDMLRVVFWDVAPAAPAAASFFRGGE